MTGSMVHIVLPPPQCSMNDDCISYRIGSSSSIQISSPSKGCSVVTIQGQACVNMHLRNNQTVEISLKQNNTSRLKIDHSPQTCGTYRSLPEIETRSNYSRLTNRARRLKQLNPPQVRNKYRNLTETRSKISNRLQRKILNKTYKHRDKTYGRINDDEMVDQIQSKKKPEMKKTITVNNLNEIKYHDGTKDSKKLLVQGNKKTQTNRLSTSENVNTAIQNQCCSVERVSTQNRNNKIAKDVSKPIISCSVKRPISDKKQMNTKLILTRSMKQMMTRNVSKLKRNKIIEKIKEGSQNNFTKQIIRQRHSSKKRTRDVTNDKLEEDKLAKKQKLQTHHAKQITRVSQRIGGKETNKQNKNVLRKRESQTHRSKKQSTPQVTTINERKSRRILQKYFQRSMQIGAKKNCYYFNYQSRKIWINNYDLYNNPKIVNCSVLLKPIQYEIPFSSRSFDFKNDIIERLYSKYCKRIPIHTRAVSNKTLGEMFMTKFVAVIKNSFSSLKIKNENKFEKNNNSINKIMNMGEDKEIDLFTNNCQLQCLKCRNTNQVTNEIEKKYYEIFPKSTELNETKMKGNRSENKLNMIGNTITPWRVNLDSNKTEMAVTRSKNRLINLIDKTAQCRVNWNNSKSESKPVLMKNINRTKKIKNQSDSSVHEDIKCVICGDQVVWKDKYIDYLELTAANFEVNNDSDTISRSKRASSKTSKCKKEYNFKIDPVIQNIKHLYTLPYPWDIPLTSGFLLIKNENFEASNNVEFIKI